MPTAKSIRDERVVLVHGRGDSPLTMTALEFALRKAGYDVSHVTYAIPPGLVQDVMAHDVEPMLRAFCDAGRVHFVTHGLGGAMLHACLQKGRPANLGRVVMIAPGLDDSHAAEVYRHNWMVRTLLGSAPSRGGGQGDGLATTLAQPSYELGVMAGRRTRKRLRYAADQIVVPASPDLTASYPLAIFQIMHFLRHGAFFKLFRFGRPAPRQMAPA